MQIVYVSKAEGSFIWLISESMFTPWSLFCYCIHHKITVGNLVIVWGWMNAQSLMVGLCFCIFKVLSRRNECRPLTIYVYIMFCTKQDSQTPPDLTPVYLVWTIKEMFSFTAKSYINITTAVSHQGKIIVKKWMQMQTLWLYNNHAC